MIFKIGDRVAIRRYHANGILGVGVFDGPSHVQKGWVKVLMDDTQTHFPTSPDRLIPEERYNAVIRNCSGMTADEFEIIEHLITNKDALKEMLKEKITFDDIMEYDVADLSELKAEYLKEKILQNKKFTPLVIDIFTVKNLKELLGEDFFA